MYGGRVNRPASASAIKHNRLRHAVCCVFTRKRTHDARGRRPQTNGGSSRHGLYFLSSSELALFSATCLLCFKRVFHKRSTDGITAQCHHNLLAKVWRFNKHRPIQHQTVVVFAVCFFHLQPQQQQGHFYIEIDDCPIIRANTKITFVRCCQFEASQRWGEIKLYGFRCAFAII